MTDKPAAFSATYSDWKLIKTRKVIQIVFEVGQERADEAYQVLGGMPNPAAEVWCAVARLEKEPPTILTKEQFSDPRQWADLKPSVQSGILRNTEAFWRYLETLGGAPIDKSEDAAKSIRAYCGVKSCSDLTADNQGWRDLYRGYRAWMNEAKVVA